MAQLTHEISGWRPPLLFAKKQKRTRSLVQIPFLDTHHPGVDVIGKYVFNADPCKVSSERAALETHLNLCESVCTFEGLRVFVRGSVRMEF